MTMEKVGIKSANDKVEAASEAMALRTRYSMDHPLTREQVKDVCMAAREFQRVHEAYYGDEINKSHDEITQRRKLFAALDELYGMLPSS